MTFGISDGEKPEWMGAGVHRPIILGNVETLKSLASARKMIVVLRHE